MKFDRRSLRLYAVTDRAWSGTKGLYGPVESALKGGATCLQLREKEMPEADFLAEALEIQALCRAYGVPFLINDNLQVALKCGADGVHVGQSDMPPKKVRALVGDKMILGVSAQTVEQAVAAQRAGADYLGVGAVFPTGTKPDAQSVDYQTLRAICQAVSIPVVAIGGISRENMPELRGAGIEGVALVSAIFAAPDIQEACQTLRALSERVVGACD